MCKGNGRQAGNKEEPPGGYPLPELEGLGEDTQHSAAAETGDAMKGTELSCCTSTVKGKAKVGAGDLMTKKVRKGEVLHCWVFLLLFLFVFTGKAYPCVPEPPSRVWGMTLLWKRGM